VARCAYAEPLGLANRSATALIRCRVADWLQHQQPSETAMSELELKVLFLIGDFACAPIDITRALGIEPTKAWVQGDRAASSDRPHRTSAWLLRSDASGNLELQQHVDALLRRLPDTLDSLLLVTPVWSAKLFCAIYTAGDRPILNLSAASVGRIARLGAEIDFDLYVMPTDQEVGPDSPVAFL
jgi:hypothetical protein